MGPHMADSHGKIKCTDADCGHELQGPLRCDATGCKGTLMHSGDVVEWMFTVYYITAFCWCVTVVYGVQWMEQQHTRNAESTHTQAQLNIMAQAKAIMITLTSDFCIQLIVQIITQIARPNLLWRPPPMASLEQRFSEFADPQMRFREFMYTDGYEGQCK